MLCLVSSHLPLSLSFFSLQISEAALLATEKSHMIQPQQHRHQSLLLGCSVKLSERPFSLCRNQPPAPCRGAPATASSVFAAQANFSLPPLCVSDSCKKRAAWLPERAFYQLPGIRTSFGWAAVLIVSSLCFQKKKKKIRKGMGNPVFSRVITSHGESQRSNNGSLVSDS